MVLQEMFEQQAYNEQLQPELAENINRKCVTDFHPALPSSQYESSWDIYNLFGDKTTQEWNSLGYMPINWQKW